MNYLQGTRGHIIVLIVFCSLLYFPRLGTPDLSGSSSELRYAEIAKEMLRDGHWIVPYFAQEEYHGKPPLYFWSVALLSAATGTITETSARLPAALSSMGIVLVTYFLGSKLFGSRAGLLAALMLACSPKIFSYARAVRMDAMYTFFFTSFLASFYYGYTYKLRQYLLLAGVAIALMVLTKGPLSLYFPSAVAFLYLVYCRDFLFLLSKDFFLCVGTFLLIVLAWAIPTYMEGGAGYFGWFHSENIALYTVEKETEWDVPLEYLGDVFMGAAPWSLFLPLILYNYYSHGRGQKETTFLLIWMAVMYVSFSLTFQRRSPYLLPLYPALSILVAAYIDKYLDDVTARQHYVSYGVLYLLAVAAGVVAGSIAGNHDIGTNLIIIAAVAFVSFGAAVLLLSRRSKSLYPFFTASLILLSVCGFTRALYFAPRAGGKISTRHLHEEIRGMMKEGAQLAMYDGLPVRYTLYFYGSMYPKKISSEDELIRFLDSTEAGYCIVAADYYQALKSRHPSLQGSEFKGVKKRYVLVSKQ
ncbi:MAG: glycosyltransferase family 39 protein [Candidatus Brocadiales bacterium]|nr:glycosyltransferase family 39 protein [Candidatus Bathyanammoxibius amoris]